MANTPQTTLDYFIAKLLEELQERREHIAEAQLNISPSNSQLAVAVASYQAERRLLDQLILLIPELADELLNPQQKD